MTDTTPAPEPYVEVSDLVVQYGGKTAVDSIGFAIPPGEVFGFIGPNGAGKTSTIRVLATLQRPTSGEVRIRGLDAVRDPTAVRGLIGYMPDRFGTYDDLTALEYLQFFAAAYHIELGRRRRVIEDVLELTELGDERRARIDSLSRGMRQRLGLARVLLHDPPVLLLDEPASGLDPRARTEMVELLGALRELGKTILISSHILPELARLATRVGIIEAGRLVAEGSVDEVLGRLRRHRRITLELTNLDDALFDRLDAIPGLADLVLGDDGVLTLSLDTDALPLDELLGRIVDAGARVTRFQPQDVDLEHAFLRLTEGRSA